MCNRLSTPIAQLLLLVDSSLRSRFAALEKQIKQAPIKPVPITPVPTRQPRKTNLPGDDNTSVSSGSCWVELEDNTWTCGKGTFTLNARVASAELGCSVDH